MPHIISTLSNPMEYAGFAPANESGGERTKQHSVFIDGGANVTQKKLVILGEGPSAKAGVSTEVSEEDLAFLQKNHLFQTHVDNGFLTISKTKANPEKVAKDMKTDTGAGTLDEGGSAQLTPKDAEEGGRLHKASKGAKLKAGKDLE